MQLPHSAAHGVPFARRQSALLVQQRSHIGRVRYLLHQNVSAVPDAYTCVARCAGARHRQALGAELAEQRELGHGPGKR